MSDLQTLSEAVIKAKMEEAVAATRQAIDNNVPVQQILDEGLIGAMDKVGEQFSKGAMFVPQMLRSAKTMQACMEVLKPRFQESGVSFKGVIVIGTVKGDLHDIGKNLVAMMLEGAGFSVIDLGVDIAAETFVKEAENNKADIVAMSALLSTTMPAMRETVQALTDAGVRDRIKVIIGGAPVTDSFAREISADAYAPDAGSSVTEVKKLLA